MMLGGKPTSTSSSSQVFGRQCSVDIRQREIVVHTMSLCPENHSQYGHYKLGASIHLDS